MPTIEDIMNEIKNRYLKASKAAADHAEGGDTSAALAASSECAALGELAIWIKTPKANG